MYGFDANRSIRQVKDRFGRDVEVEIYDYLWSYFDELNARGLDMAHLVRKADTLRKAPHDLSSEVEWQLYYMWEAEQSGSPYYCMRRKPNARSYMN